MNCSIFKKQLLDKVNTVLKPSRFKKNQNIFTFSNKDLTYYICMQVRGDSTSYVMHTTINVEIASAKLSYLDDLSIPGYLHRHYVKNIGKYTGQLEDKWWTIYNLPTALSAQQEITDILKTKVLPELNQLQSTNDLAALWNTQIGPGLTQYQRDEYLSLLEKADNIKYKVTPINTLA
jgi:hypothetical protein